MCTTPLWRNYGERMYTWGAIGMTTLIRQALVRILLTPSLLGLACWLLVSAANATPVVSVPASLPLADMYGNMEYVEDPTGQLTLAQVRALPAERFTTLQRHNFSKGFTASTYWLRFNVTNSGPAPVDWVLQHRLTLTDFVETWVLVGETVKSHTIAGDRTTLAQRQLPLRLPSFQFLSAPGETAEVVVRISNVHKADVQLSFRLDAHARFVASTERDGRLLGILYGVPLALVFSSLVGVAVARDRRLSVYALYALATLASWTGFNGLLPHVVPIDAPDLWNNMLHVCTLLQSIFSSMFAREFLQTHIHQPRMDAFFKGTIGVACFAILLRAFGVYTPVTQLTLLLSGLSVVTVLAGWRAMRQGLVYARWYLLAQLFCTVPALVGIVGVRIGLYAYDGFINYQFLFFAQLIMLSIAQHDRVRILQDKQKELERDHEQALEERNRYLEAEVAERSKRLEEMGRRAAFVTEVQAVTKRVAGGEFSARLPHAQDADMDQLATSVNTMSESLAKLDGARRRWIAEISHELRTPLSALIADIEAILDGVRRLDHHQVESLHRTALGLARLVDDLHELAMSYVRPMACKFAAVNFPQLLSDLMPHFEGKAHKKGLQLSLQMDTPVRTGMWDYGRINQLMINLIDNSISYTDAPGQICITVTALEHHLRIEVEDSAPGLTPYDQEHLFEPLYRADAARSRHTGGSGLGLKISKVIAEAHHAQIDVYPSQLGGMRVRVDLPFAREAP